MSHPWKNVTDIEGFIERNSFYNGRTFGIKGELYFLNLKNEQDFLCAFNACPPLKSIIGKRAKAFNSGWMEVTRPPTDERSKGKKASGQTANMLRAVIQKPNVLQTKKQFFAQHNHYIDIFGYCPVLKIRPSGMPDVISQLWNIPPWLFDIEYTDKWLRQNSIEGIYKEYYLNWMGERTAIPKKDMFFVFDDGIGTDFDSNLTIPDSRLISLEYPVSNIIAAYKSRNTLITKRGAIGILSNETKDGDSGSVPLRKEEKEDIQKDFQKYGLVGQAFQVIITDANLKWQQMGFPTKDLMLFEEIQDSTNQLCNAYGYPSGLLAQIQQSTFSNKQVDRKDFIENTIMPESESRMEQFSKGVVPEEEEGKLEVTQDYSGLTILQEDKKLSAEARKALNDALKIEYDNGLITKNMWLEKLGEEKQADEEFDKYRDAAEEKEAETQRTIAIQTAKIGAKLNGKPAGQNGKLPAAVAR